MKYIYEHRDVSMKGMLSLLWKYTKKFENKTVYSFTSWGSTKFPFYASRTVKKVTKKHNNNMERIRYRKMNL